MEGGAHPSNFTALAFPNSQKVPIHCWVDTESFPVVACQSPALNSQPYGHFLHHNWATLTMAPLYQSFNQQIKKLFHKHPIFEAVKLKVINPTFETVRLSVSI